MTGLGWGGPSSSLRQGGDGGGLQRGGTGLSGDQLSVCSQPGTCSLSGAALEGRGPAFCLLPPSVPQMVTAQCLTPKLLSASFLPALLGALELQTALGTGASPSCAPLET